MKKLILILMCLLIPALAWAEINLFAEVSSNKVAMDSVLRLSLTITGTQSVTQIPAPAVDGFQVKYLGPATRISIINGQTFASHTYRYALYPLKVGKFQIPAVSIDINGKTYSSKPIDIEVVDAGTPVPGTAPSNTASGSEPGLKGKIFATMTAPRQEVYKGEALPVTIRMFVSGLSVSDIEYPQLEGTGFSVGEFKEPRQYQQVIGDARYDVLEFNVDIYPETEGAVSLGRAKINSQMLYRSKKDERLPFDDFDNFLNEDFFDSFLSFYERRPLAIESTDLTVNVLPLPEEGKPKDFSGAVGRFDFDVSVSPTEVNVGDPVTVRMKISGNNIKSLKPPAVNAQGFKLYDPQIKEENGSKIIEQVAIPATDQIKEFPAVSFSYFNPETKVYETITRGPFPLAVKAVSKGQELKVVGLDKEEDEVVSEQPESLGQDIRFIKEDPDTFHRIGYRLLNNILFWVMFALLFIAWLSVYILYRRQHRLRTDTAYARRLLAPVKAREGLTQARQAIQQNDGAQFYEVIFRAIREYLADKYHLSAGMTFGELKNVLESRGLNKDKIAELSGIFEECDMARYAPVKPDSARMKEMLERVENVIDYLERHSK